MDQVEELNAVVDSMAKSLERKANFLFSSRHSLQVHSKVVISDMSPSYTHITVPNGKVLQVSFGYKVPEARVELSRWYLISPSRQESAVLCYPYRPHADTIINELRTGRQYTRVGEPLRVFNEFHARLQDYLERMSSGIETIPGPVPSASWVIDPAKLALPD